MNDSTSEGQSECAVLSIPLGVWVWDFRSDYTITLLREIRSYKRIQRPFWDSNPGPPGQKYNAITSEPNNRLPDAVFQRSYLSDTRQCVEQLRYL